MDETQREQVLKYRAQLKTDVDRTINIIHHIGYAIREIQNARGYMQLMSQPPFLLELETALCKAIEFEASMAVSLIHEQQAIYELNKQAGG